jgi:hypothetical protein
LALAFFLALAFLVGLAAESDAEAAIADPVEASRIAIRLVRATSHLAPRITEIPHGISEPAPTLSRAD